MAWKERADLIKKNRGQLKPGDYNRNSYDNEDHKDEQNEAHKDELGVFSKIRRVLFGPPSSESPKTHVWNNPSENSRFGNGVISPSIRSGFDLGSATGAGPKLVT